MVSGTWCAASANAGAGSKPWTRSYNLNLDVGLAEPEEHSQFRFHKLELKKLQVELTVMKGAMAKTFVFLGVLVVHWAAQFLAWSYAEHSPSMRVLWKILATPLVLAAGSATNQYFWIVVSLNSLVWAAVLAYLTTRLSARL